MRLRGAGARGSIPRASSGSRVVTEIITHASRLAAIGARRSRSRRTRFDFVTMATGWLNAAKTSSSRLEIPSLRSAGW